MASVSTLLGDLPSGADGELTTSAPSAHDWHNLRNAAGRILATYSPSLKLLIIKERGQRNIYDLRKLEPGSCQDSTIVLG